MVTSPSNAVPRGPLTEEEQRSAIALTVQCPQCSRTPGNACVDIRGKLAGEPHPVRLAAGRQKQRAEQTEAVSERPTPTIDQALDSVQGIVDEAVVGWRERALNAEEALKHERIQARMADEEIGAMAKGIEQLQAERNILQGQLDELVELAITDRDRAVLDRLDGILQALGGKPAGRGESHSSVTVKDSTRGIDIDAKAYEGSPTDGLAKRAVDLYFEAQDEFAQRKAERAAGEYRRAGQV
jgi:hypothetical protein